MKPIEGIRTANVKTGETVAILADLSCTRLELSKRVKRDGSTVYRLHHVRHYADGRAVEPEESPCVSLTQAEARALADALAAELAEPIKYI